MQGSILSLIPPLIVLVEESFADLDPNDKYYQIRMDGLNQIKNGVATQLGASLTVITAIDDYPDKERLICTNYLIKYGPDLMDFVHVDFKRKYEISLEKHLKVETNNEIRKLIKDFLKKL